MHVYPVCLGLTHGVWARPPFEVARDSGFLVVCSERPAGYLCPTRIWHACQNFVLRGAMGVVFKTALSSPLTYGHLWRPCIYGILPLPHEVRFLIPLPFPTPLCHIWCASWNCLFSSAQIGCGFWNSSFLSPYARIWHYMTQTHLCTHICTPSQQFEGYKCHHI